MWLFGKDREGDGLLRRVKPSLTIIKFGLFIETVQLNVSVCLRD